MKYSTSTIRFLLAFPFGLLAETFARLTMLISGGQCDVDFNYIHKHYFKEQKGA